MTETTLCFLIQGNPPQRLLLGFKKVGFGAGKYTGFGGKVRPGETPSAAAIRELAEETGIHVREADLRPMGQFTFLFPSRPPWSQLVHVFVVYGWEGAPTESREMLPVWFSVDQIPVGWMWEDAVYWLPYIVSGEPIQALFTFGADNETIADMEIRLLSSRPGET